MHQLPVLSAIFPSLNLLSSAFSPQNFLNLIACDLIMHISVLDRNSGTGSSLFRNLEKEKYLNAVLRVWTNINKAKTLFQ